MANSLSKKPRIAILSRPDDRSPKILAMGLQQMLESLGYESAIFYEGSSMLGRLFPLRKKIYNQIRLHFRIRTKLRYFFRDRALIRQLAQYDIIVLSECIPNAYWRGYYAIEELRARIRKPICLYEVYYLGTSIKYSQELMAGHHHGLERYDWNFSITDTTEKQEQPSPEKKWSVIGLDLSHTGLEPQVKNEFIVLVDFLQAGFEESRKMQLEVLAELGIKTIALEGSYRMEEIRELYKKASVLMVQFPEAFGLPMAECLSTGAYIMVPDPFWAMAWRKKDEHSSDFYLPSFFVQYQGRAGLREKLWAMSRDYDPLVSPQWVSQSFKEAYPHFYSGDLGSLNQAIEQISRHQP
ncbi:MAG: hypothetical protein JST58_01045 [Bacteroidetes bacterium]|nr:hypothetical protein [Bacteroidota bacterium]